MKKLKKPPVFYSLIQIRFNRITLMHTYVPAFQEALRKKGFPDFSPETQLEVQIMQSAGGQPNVEQRNSQRWVFNDLERTAGFVLLEDALVYHTTSYAGYTECRQRVLEALALLHELLGGLSYVQRVGMRYLDAFVPSREEQLEDYVLPELLGLSQMPLGDLKHSYCETVRTVDDATLVMKAFITSVGLPMPPDLQQLTLALPDRLREPAGPCLVMDSDCFTEKRVGYDSALLEQRLDSLHETLIHVFNQSITEKARAQWKT